MQFQFSLRPGLPPRLLVIRLLPFVSQFLPHLIGTDAMLMVTRVASHLDTSSVQPVVFPAQDCTAVFWVEQEMKKKKKIIDLYLGMISYGILCLNHTQLCLE